MTRLHLPGPGGAMSPRPDGVGQLPGELPPHIPSQAMVCRECGNLTYVPPAMVKPLTELHARACIGPKIAAISDNVDTLLSRLSLLANTLRVIAGTAGMTGDEDDDEPADQAVGDAGDG